MALAICRKLLKTESVMVDLQNAKDKIALFTRLNHDQENELAVNTDSLDHFAFVHGQGSCADGLFAQELRGSNKDLGNDNAVRDSVQSSPPDRWLKDCCCSRAQRLRQQLEEQRRAYQRERDDLIHKARSTFDGEAQPWTFPCCRVVDALAHHARPDPPSLMQTSWRRCKRPSRSSTSSSWMRSTRRPVRNLRSMNLCCCQGASLHALANIVAAVCSCFRLWVNFGPASLLQIGHG